MRPRFLETELCQAAADAGPSQPASTHGYHNSSSARNTAPAATKTLGDIGKANEMPAATMNRLDASSCGSWVLEGLE